METSANDIANLETQFVNDDETLLDYDNESEDGNEYQTGYRSEELDEEEEQADEENNCPKPGYNPRGITRLNKFRYVQDKPGALKLVVTFDGLKRIKGNHRAVFSSFLGDVVRERIGVKVYSWRKVDPEARKKLWDEITVQLYISNPVLHKFISSFTLCATNLFISLC
jgi:hypothetical protein